MLWDSSLDSANYEHSIEKIKLGNLDKSSCPHLVVTMAFIDVSFVVFRIFIPKTKQRNKHISKKRRICHVTCWIRLLCYWFIENSQSKLIILAVRTTNLKIN